MSVSTTTTVTTFSRGDLARILRLPERQIIAWQRAGLMPEAEVYSFADLTHLKRLQQLKATSMSAKSIRNSVTAMQKVAGMRHPLRETSAVRQGKRLIFRHSGALIDPQTQQLAFDFEQGSLGLVKPAGRNADSEQASRVQEMFLRAVRLEENATTIDEAAALYEEVLKLQPGYAAASINLGTIRYNQRNFVEAEKRYRYATEVDPLYALAFFDLGNVLDELQRLPEAIEAYQRAIALVPEYADAHYNLALAFERQEQRRKALRYWLSYVRLDPIGPWASHARSQVQKILASEKLKVVCRRGERAS
ncbi:MAG: tetratricopeptide repeat protein [Acidobacteria bacterium]|nr:tetratricopeptide repeat protein [Acidobacteriota bacterium]